MSQNSQTNANWYADAIEEAKDHLSPTEMKEFIFNKDALQIDQLSNFQSHIQDCTRCKTRHSKIEEDKPAYLSCTELEL